MTELPAAVVVAGFHRSGTSLTARRLQVAGLPLGRHLLPPHPSNPEGHFEDSAVVAFDDAWLARHRTNWLFHDEVPLAPDARLAADLAAYVASRDADGAAWAIKDPRLCLALPAWEQALGARGRWLVVIRHWAECVQSLLHRQSREALFGVLPATHAHLRPWREPFVTHRAWLATSRRLLAFAAARPDTAIVATTRAIAALPSLDPLLERLGVVAPFRESGATVRDDLLHRSTRAAMLPAPTPALRAALDETWEALLAIAGWRTGDEDVAWDARRAPAYVRAAVDAGVAAAAAPTAAAVAPAEAPRVDADAAIARLALLPPGRQTPLALVDARRLQRQGDVAGAERVLRAALATSTTLHPLWLLLGDLHHAAGRGPEAIDAYRRSYALKPSPHSAMKVARAHLAAREWQDAVEMLDAVLAGAPERVDARLLRANAIEHLSGPDAALLSLADAPPDPDIRALEAQLTLATSAREGLRRNEARVRERLAATDLVPWLAAASLATGSGDAWSGFVEAVWRHGSRLLGEREFASRLGVRMPPDPSAFAEGPLAALCAADALLADAAGAALRAAGWSIADGPDLAFDAAFAGVAPGDDADAADVHAARTTFLHQALASGAATARWGFQHPRVAGFADALLPAVPGLRVAWLHAGARPVLAGWPRADRPAATIERRAALAGWLADWRRANDLQARWPGRFALVDLRYPEAAAIAWRGLFGDAAGAPPPMPDALARVVAAAASLDDLAADDAALLRRHALA